MSLIVVDSSALVTLLVFNDSRAEQVASKLRSGSAFFAPNLLDYEVLSSLRGIATKDGRLTDEIIRTALTNFANLPIRRESPAPLIERIWELRHNYSAYDAAYVALAEHLGAKLLTCDLKMANGSGAKCPIDAVA